MKTSHLIIGAIVIAIAAYFLLKKKSDKPVDVDSRKATEEKKETKPAVGQKDKIIKVDGDLGPEYIDSNTGERIPVDENGNPTDLEGNPIDIDGNVLPVDENGMPIYPPESGKTKGIKFGRGPTQARTAIDKDIAALPAGVTWTKGFTSVPSSTKGTKAAADKTIGYTGIDKNGIQYSRCDTFNGSNVLIKRTVTKKGSFGKGPTKAK